MGDSPGYKDDVWDIVKQEWLSGQLSVSDIARTYGPSRQAITSKAERMKWGKRGSLVEQVRKEVESQLLEDEGVAAGVAPLEASEIIESAAKRGVTVVRRHRVLIAELLDIVGATLEEIREMAVISSESLKKKRTKHQAALVAALSKARLDSMRVVSGVLSQAIPLERQAFSLDDEKGGGMPIKYVAPEYKKPLYSGLSEDEWQDDNAAKVS